jgi:hypothetical protein
VNKNWTHDPRVGCLKPSNLTTTCEETFDSTNELDVKFVHKVGHEKYIDEELWFILHGNKP